eukprot:8665030-Pyramimonas_sp.AAC.1
MARVRHLFLECGPEARREQRELLRDCLELSGLGGSPVSPPWATQSRPERPHDARAAARSAARK